MADFLRQLAREIENNKALARRLSEPFQIIFNESLAASPSRAAAKSAKGSSKQKKYPVPDDLNPFQVFYDEGSPGLCQRLYALEIDQIKGILSNYTSIPRQEYSRKQNRELLVELAVQGIKNVATHGQEFGDYKLPD